MRWAVVVISLTLDKIVRGDTTRLPRAESDQSKAIFERLVNAENLDAFQTKFSSATMRSHELNSLLLTVTAIVADYLKAGKPGAIFDIEVLQLGTFLIKLEHSDYVAAMAAGDAANRDPEGIAKIKGGIAKSTCGLILLIADEKSMRTAPAIAAAEDLEKLLPKIQPDLAPDGLAAVQKQLAESEQAVSGKERKTAIGKLMDATK